MNRYIQVILNLIRNLSLRLHLFFKRQKVVLISESHILNFIESNRIETNLIVCNSCGAKLTVDQIEGLYFDNDGKVLFFCNNLSCNPLNKDRG